MPKRPTKPQKNKHDSESDENSGEEIESNYDLRNRKEKPASPFSKYKSAAIHVSNTSLEVDSGSSDESDKSLNLSHESKSSSDGYGSPFRSSPNTGSPAGIYPILPTNQNLGVQRSNLYPKLNQSLDNFSQDSEFRNQSFNESLSWDARDSNNKLRYRNINDNNSCVAFKTESCREPQTYNSNNDKNSSSNCIIISLVLLIILAVVSLWLMTSSDVSTTTQATMHISPYDSFISEINSLEKKFPNQSKRFWNTFKASSRHILVDQNSDYPSVILMASQTNNGHIASCIAKLATEKFESVVPNKLPEFTVADLHMLKHLSSGEQKKKLDEKLTETFRHHKSVILDNLQSLSPDAALLLHGYCDNDNAPYKDVMMVLILHVDPHQLKLDPDSTNSVEKYLQGLWTQGLHEDKVAALLSRVANNVVVINAEDDNTVSKACSNL